MARVSSSILATSPSCMSKYVAALAPCPAVSGCGAGHADARGGLHAANAAERPRGPVLRFGRGDTLGLLATEAAVLHAARLSSGVCRLGLVLHGSLMFVELGKP